jgi:hypothetical protein
MNEQHTQQAQAIPAEVVEDARDIFQRYGGVLPAAQRVNLRRIAAGASTLNADAAALVVEEAWNFITHPATAIFQQLGGQRFATMVGAHDLVRTPRGLHFKVGKNANGIRRVHVILGANDTYIVRFHTDADGLDDGQEFEGVYNDQLPELFEEVTGMATRL